MLKRFACHITAHRPVEAMLDLQRESRVGPDGVQAVTVAGNRRMATTNKIPAPPDALLAQYSIPFCVALSLYRNPVDPDSFDDQMHKDSGILAMAARVKMDTIAGQPNDDLTSIGELDIADDEKVGSGNLNRSMSGQAQPSLCANTRLIIMAINAKPMNATICEKISSGETSPRRSRTKPATRFTSPHTTFVVDDDIPRPGGFAKGVGNWVPVIPRTKCGTKFAIKAPPKNAST